MKTKLMFVIVLLSFQACGGGGSDGNSTQACGAFRVLNGQECTRDGLPVVKLLVDGNTFTCTGTVISNDEVLTAAHCVGRSEVIVEHDRGTQSAIAGYINPLSSISPAFDVGIVRFPNIATNLGLKPARFNLQRATQVGDRIKVIGYGEDGTPQLANGNPRATELVVTQVESGVITSEFDTTGSGPCYGDSGAAATYNGLIVASVHGGGDLTTGADTCAAGSTAVFSDLQIEGNIEFIKENAPSAVFEQN